MIDEIAAVVCGVPGKGQYMTGLARAAAGWLARGAAVIPLAGKRPTIRAWKRYQATLPAATDLTRWFTGQHVTGYGLICGDVSGGLVVLDFDHGLDYAAFVATQGTLSDTFTVQTGRGYHAYLYVDDLPYSQTIRTADFAVEIKANGCYVAGPWSLHPGGKRYRVSRRKPIKRVADLGEAFQRVKTQEPIRTSQHIPAALPASTTTNPNPDLTGKIAAALNWRGPGEWLNGHCVNPDHDDRHPSAGFNTVSGVYNCFACGRATLKRVAVWLDIDSRDGWQYQRASSASSGSNARTLHVNLATHYPDKRAYPLVAAVDMWLSAGNDPRATLVEFCQLTGYTPERVRYLVRRYGAAMYVVINGDAISTPTLYHLARMCGVRGVGPAHELPDHVDASTRGGASAARSWLFLADRQGKPTPARWMAKQLGHASHQTVINHAHDLGVQILRGQTSEITEAEAERINYKPVFWLTSIDCVRKWHDTREAARAFLADRIGEISAVVTEANRYIVSLSMEISARVHRLDTMQEVFGGGSTAMQALARLTAPTTLPVATNEPRGRYKRSPWRAYPVQSVKLE